MARILFLDKSLYFQGQVNVYQGDAWNIGATVFEVIGGVKTPLNLTGCGATGFFPGAASPIPVIATIDDPLGGHMTFGVPPGATPNVTPGAIAMYAEVDGLPATGHPFTAQMPDSDLVVLSQSFTPPT